MFHDCAVVQRIQARDAERLGIFEERRVALVERFPIGDGNLAAIERSDEFRRDHVFVRNTENSFCIHPAKNLIRRSNDDELGASTLALNARIGSQSRRKCHVVSQGQGFMRNAIHCSNDAASKVLLGRKRLRLCKHFQAICVNYHSIRVRATGVDAQPYHAAASSLVVQNAARISDGVLAVVIGNAGFSASFSNKHP